MASAVAGGAVSVPGGPSVRPNCGAVSIGVLDSALGIAATTVHTTHPAPPAGLLICSYIGASGGEKNEATINFVPAGATQFAAVEVALGKQHKIVPVSCLLDGAYSYRVAPDYYLYVLDGTTQVQLFVAVAVSKLEKLARRLPTY